MRRGAGSTFWKALAAVAVVSAVGNAVATNVFVATMTPQDWGERILPALGWALVLTLLTVIFVLVSTIWLDPGERSSRWTSAVLAVAGPATAWSIIGLVIGGWLFPLYALYGLGAGILASGAFTLAVALLTRSGQDRASA
jgi:hypothetical protein